MIVKAGANGKGTISNKTAQKKPKDIATTCVYSFIFIIKLLKQKCSFLLNQGILKLQLNLLRY
jgi:hypothetical protein